MPDISKINALAIGDVAKVDGLAKASILDIDGVAIAVVPAPAAAYSVRLLGSAVGISSYTDDCMRVRRASDNVEADVGFDAGELKLTSPISNTSDALSYTDFADFVDHTGTPTSAFVRYWYDQSGNSLDAGQATAGSQPKIYDATTGLIEDGSAGNEKPALDFDGTDDGLTLSSLTYGNAITLVSLYNQASSGGRIWCDDITGQQGYWILFGVDVLEPQKVYINDGSGFDNWTHQTAALNQQNLLGIYFSSSQIIDSLNGTTQTQSVTGFSPPINLSGSSAGFAIGNSGNMADPMSMKGQEFILYNSDQITNRTRIENNINWFFSVYT